MGYNNKRTKTHSKFGISSIPSEFKTGLFKSAGPNSIPLLSSTYNEIATDGRYNYFPTETSLQVKFQGGGLAQYATKEFDIWETSYTGVDKFPPYTCAIATGIVSTPNRFNMYRIIFLPHTVTPFSGNFYFSDSSSNKNQNQATQLAGNTGDFDIGLLAPDGNNLGGTMYYKDLWKKLTWKVVYDNSVPTDDDIVLNFNIILF